VPTEEAEVDDFCLAGVDLCQTFKGFVESKDIEPFSFDSKDSLMERLAFPPADAFGRADSPGMIDEYAAHGAGGGGEQESAIRCASEDVASEELQQSLVDKGAGLEGVVGPLATHEVASDAPELVIDRPDESIHVFL
jgi:hypothetical protein